MAPTFYAFAVLLLFFTAGLWVDALQPGARRVTTRVDDGVLCKEQCDYLGRYLSQSAAGDASAVREASAVWDSTTRPRTPVEEFIGSYLAAHDSARFVEYWSRAEWAHVEAHVDLDEAAFRADRSRRTPTAAHVAYLKVDDAVRGPTCVLEEDEQDGRDRDVVLAVVPAVEGRVLRFQGDLLHGVPRPASRWIGSSDDEDLPRLDRAVILFNTWHDPPADVPLDALGVPDDGPAVDCRVAATWSRAPFDETAAAADASCCLAIDLLGSKVRRRRHARHLNLICASPPLSAFEEPAQPTRLRAVAPYSDDRTKKERKKQGRQELLW